jgi:hypothetical protein
VRVTSSVVLAGPKPGTWAMRRLCIDAVGGSMRPCRRGSALLWRAQPNLEGLPKGGAINRALS